MLEFGVGLVLLDGDLDVNLGFSFWFFMRLFEIFEFELLVKKFTNFFLDSFDKNWFDKFLFFEIGI